MEPCPQCGEAIPPDSPAGLCPACLGDGLFGDDGDSLILREEIEALGEVGGYQLLEVLGEGGFGIVYRARCEEPIARQAAVKLIKPGMDSAAVLAGFEAERSALALMSHPGIAMVYDAGTTDSRRPWFAMELVEGQSITAHCRQHELALRERLELFTQVCEAVAHAHRKGVIHRDIKPSNVLADDTGQAKVIDFGIARATEEPLGSGTLLTRAGALLGTPEYMSPEQASGNSEAVDTRTDVYSLGALLYELLTDQPAFDPDQLRSLALDRMLQSLREDDPPAPSTRLRGSGTQSLARQLRGELDWIVGRAMEKDPARRYQSVADLGADITRSLNNEPVTARPPGGLYRLSKWMRRHRAATAAALVAILAALTAAVGITKFALEADSARHHANELLASGELAAARDRVESQEHAHALAHLARALRAAPSAPEAKHLLLDLARHPGIATPSLPPFEYRSNVGDFTWADDDRLLVGADLSGQVRLWDSQTGKIVFEIEAPDIASQNLSSNGRWFSFGTSTGQGGIVDCRERSVYLSTRPFAQHGQLSATRVSASGNTLFTGSHAGTTAAHALPSGDESWSLKTGSQIWELELSPDGESLAIGTRDGRLLLVDAATGDLRFEIKHRTAINAIAFDPRGALLASGDIHGGLLIHRTADGTAASPPLRHEREAYELAFHPTLPELAVVGKSALNFWQADEDDTNWEHRLYVPNRDVIWFIEYRSDGSAVAISDRSGAVRVIDRQTGSDLISPIRHTEDAHAAHFSADGLRLATAGRERMATVYHLPANPPEEGYAGVTPQRDPTPVPEFLKGQRIASLDLDPSGQTYAVGRFDNSAQLYDATTGKAVGAALRHEDSPEADGLKIQFIDGGRSLLTWNSRDMAILVWDPHTSRLRFPAISHNRSPIVAVSVSPDGWRIASSGNDGYLRCHSARTGGALIVPRRLHKQTVDLAWSSDGRALINYFEGEDEREFLLPPIEGGDLPPALLDHLALRSGWQLTGSNQLTRGDLSRIHQSRATAADTLQELPTTTRRWLAPLFDPEKKN